MSERRMPRARGQTIAAVGTVVAVAAALTFLDRAGIPSPASADGGAASSGAWICPHGGGEDWDVSVFLANPGSEPVTARVTGLSDRAPEPATTIEVPPETTVAVPAVGEGRGDATYIEHFGGWIGAGWVAASGSPGEGLAAEPCADEASRRWFIPDGGTQLEEQAFVVIANPFDVTAVLDAVVYTPDRAPVRDAQWTNLAVRPHRSVVLHLNENVTGETVAATAIEVSVGRVVAGSVGVTDGTRVRSTLGSTGAVPGAVLPAIGGSGQAELIVLSVAERTIRFGATALTEDLPRPADGLTEEDHSPQAARAYPVQVSAGPTAIRPFVLDGAVAVSGLRVLGSRDDLGSTAGTSEPAVGWVVLPAFIGSAAEPAIVLANDGEAASVATLEILPGEGGTAVAPITVDVPAHGTAAVPTAFLASAPGSAIVVRATEPIVALSAASAPGGDAGGGAYALSMGVPLPQTS